MAKDLKVKIEGGESPPICQHCKEDIAEIIDYRSSMPKQHFLQNLHLIACGNCRGVLGTAIIMK